MRPEEREVFVTAFRFWDKWSKAELSSLEIWGGITEDLKQFDQYSGTQEEDISDALMLALFDVLEKRSESLQKPHTG